MSQVKEHDRITRVNDLRTVLSSRPGRRFYWRTMQDSGVFASTFTGDALTSAFKEGRRAQGLDLMQEAQKVAPMKYLLMLEEAAQDAREAALLLEAENKAALAAEE
ncbi:MAG: hypothetical protein Q8L48_16775 [Archangium sp.]|nr:hypothetical protein [Archangium sp.]